MLSMLLATSTARGSNRCMKQWVAWLRGINTGAAGKGRKSVPMAELRSLAAGLGWQDVQTYIQSGNLMFAATGTAAKLEEQLEAAIREHFSFDVPVCALPMDHLLKALQQCPFPGEVEERANLVHMGLVKRDGMHKGKLQIGLAGLLEPYCTNGERVIVLGPYLWTDCPNGVGRSKVTPAVLDRAAGASVTMRNAKTVKAICEMRLR